MLSVCRLELAARGVWLARERERGEAREAGTNSTARGLNLYSIDARCEPGSRVGLQGLRFGIWGLGFSVFSLGFRVQGSGFRV